MPACCWRNPFCSLHNYLQRTLLSNLQLAQQRSAAGPSPASSLSQLTVSWLPCRHYVNNLVQYTTGVERASAKVAQAAFRKKRKRLRLTDSVFFLGHVLTDVAYWPRVRAFSQATLAAVAALTGRSMWAHLAVPRLAAASQPALAPAVRQLQPMQLTGRLPRRPVYVAAGASVTAYAAGVSEMPLLRDALSLGARLGDSMRSAATGARR